MRHVIVFCLACCGLALSADQPFTHPGLLHTQADLDFIKRKIAAREEPWKSAFEKFSAHPQSSAGYKLRGPFESVTRDPRGSVHNDEMVSDANAAYQNALMWCLTGEEAHAKKS